VSDLQDQLQEERLACAELAARSEAAQRKLREVAERSRARGNMLVQLVAAVGAVAAAKEALAAAEAELAQVVVSASAMVQVGGERQQLKGPTSHRCDTRNTRHPLPTGNPLQQDCDNIAGVQVWHPSVTGEPPGASRKCCRHRGHGRTCRHQMYSCVGRTTSMCWR
jgi:hypothetical protein